VPDYNRLADAILAAAPDLLGSVQTGKVRYQPATYDAAGGIRVADPFIKPLAFAWQGEVRLAFEPKGQIQNFLDVQSPEIAAALDFGKEV
jgi:hypothetical protein